MRFLQDPIRTDLPVASSDLQKLSRGDCGLEVEPK